MGAGKTSFPLSFNRSSLGSLLHKASGSCFLFCSRHLTTWSPTPESLPMLSFYQLSGKLLFSLQNPAQVTHSGKPLGHGKPARVQGGYWVSGRADTGCCSAQGGGRPH